MIEFIETPTFTQMVLSLLTDDEYLKIQLALIKNPQQGVLLVAGGGIRKMRISLKGQSKRDGGRMIYYWLKDEGQIYMLVVFAKATTEDLTADQTAVLKEYVKGLNNE